MRQISVRSTPGLRNSCGSSARPQPKASICATGCSRLVQHHDDVPRLEREAPTQVPWESCTSLERRALKVIAERTIALGSRDADRRYGLAKGGSAQAAVERLFADGHLIQDQTTRTGWRIVDPFLAHWLRES